MKFTTEEIAVVNSLKFPTHKLNNLLRHLYLSLPSTVSEAKARSAPSLFLTSMSNRPLSSGCMSTIVSVLKQSLVSIFILSSVIQNVGKFKCGKNLCISYKQTLQHIDLLSRL